MQEMVAVMGRRERGQERLVGGSRKGEKIGEGKMECLSMRAHCLSPPGSGQLLFSSNVGRTPPQRLRMVEGGGQTAAPAGKAQLRTMEGELCHHDPHPKFLHSLLIAEGAQGVGIWCPPLPTLHPPGGAPC